MKIYYCVEVCYPGGPDDKKDKALEKAVGRKSDGSGMFMMGRGERDINWDYEKKSAAENAASRIRQAKIKGIKVNIIQLED